MLKPKEIDPKILAANNPYIDLKLLEEYRALKESFYRNSERVPMGTTYRFKGPFEERFSGSHKLGANGGVRRGKR